MTAKIPVLVPYQPDRGHRDRVWGFLRNYFWEVPRGMGRHFRVVEGRSPDGAFNRSAAINDAAAKAGGWDVAIIADADTWVHPDQISEAVDAARRTGLLVSALTSVVELDAASTAAILDALGTLKVFGLRAERVRTDDLATQSSMLAVPRHLFDHIGGFDEKFIGWGGEDNAFWKAAAILGGTPLRVNGAAYHLWHETADVAERMLDPLYRANLQRWRRYDRAFCTHTLRKAQQS